MDSRPLQSDELLPPEDTALYTSLPAPRALGAEEWALIRYVGEPLGEIVPLGVEGIGIGRAGANSLVLPEAEVSRQHARVDLVAEGEALVPELRDLGSTNGTFVNGHRLPEGGRPLRLQAGDVVRVGGHAFKLKRLDALERSFHEALRVQSTQDALTGVSNRATVLGFLEKQSGLARRHSRPLSVILVDLDHFKDVNDCHGHAAGDAVLGVFGGLALERLRASDHVGRIGGEEFLVVLPETALHEATKVAEALRRRLGEAPLECGRRVTASFGVAQLREETTGAFLARADAALYRAKSLGRDRVEHDG